mmetsp:Transcript_26285/g.45698  ORF Transcript_26285/g.45698 Transcript_26285/m.45698 type:complete len:85 (+) Transcript_26285:32-286(+)
MSTSRASQKSDPESQWLRFVLQELSSLAPSVTNGHCNGQHVGSSKAMNLLHHAALQRLFLSVAEANLNIHDLLHDVCDGLRLVV